MITSSEIFIELILTENLVVSYLNEIKVLSASKGEV